VEAALGWGLTCSDTANGVKERRSALKSVVDAERAVGQVRGWVMAGRPEEATRALRHARGSIDALIRLLS
jgi:hypothetical protein